MPAAGDVIRIYDGTVNPPAHKRFVCVYPVDGWMLRINTQPHWTPHFPLLLSDNPGCLDHDCFLELRGVVEYIQSEIDNGEPLGRLSDQTIAALVAHLPSVVTIALDQCRIIIAALEAELP